MSFFFKSSDKDEKGKFFPEPSDPYFSKASFFSISSRSLILKVTFLLSESSSAIAQSILSPPVNLEGLASAAFIAIWDFLIKKTQIAINTADARPSRFTGGERIDCAISELDLNKRKVNLSIKLLEEIEKKEALEKYGTEGSGKNLPFSSLSDDLKNKKK